MSAFQENIELIREVRADLKSERPSPYFGRAERTPDPISKERLQRRQLQEKFWAAGFRKANARGRIRTWLADRAFNHVQKDLRKLKSDPRALNANTWSSGAR